MGDLYDDAVAQLSAWRADDPVRQRFLDLLASSPEVMWAGYPEAHVTASAMIVHPDLERVLLCLHGRMNKWVQVGGHCEPGDNSLLEAAMREAREESGLQDFLAQPVPIDLDIHQVNCRHGASYHYDVRFALLAQAGQVEQVSDESHELGWFAADSLPTPMAHATEHLVPLALKAFR
ncbi:NUDIX hydrolase [Rhizocola hellebori]|uniref:NUDIX hydrolase n=1 Tax=Rhizocola hellebori TaxID=1392758 RepID=A0A8J3VHN2_9ACTN|nr:NUDIX domain-containing protein [Rhizocola hellebori]GIH06206.1 NUDIX hydrolase [Rhizocola hellebori]